MQNNTVLVTGGAGFIGAHTVQYLLNSGHHVVVLDDLSGGFKSNVPEAVEFVEGSILDVDLIERLFEKYHFNYVYHLAAYAAEGLSHFIRRFNYQNNLIGSINLINAAIKEKVKCFVFASSIAVYGKNELPYTETQHPEPEDPYGIAKFAVEMDLKNAREMFGLNSIIFRPHNVYGSRQNIGDKYRNVVGIFMNQLLKDEPLTVFGDGEQTRAFSHINDVAPYIANSIDIPEAYNKTFNIGGEVPFTVNQLAKMIGEVMGKTPELNYLPERNEVVNAYADHSLFQTVFKPKKSVDLKIGLMEMSEWVKENGAKQSTDFTGIEIEENLPPSWR